MGRSALELGSRRRGFADARLARALVRCRARFARAPRGASRARPRRGSAPPSPDPRSLPSRNCETGAGLARTRALGRRRIASRSRPRSPLAPRSSRGRRSGGASSCARRPSRPRRSHPRLARLLRGPRARPGFLPRSALARVGFPNSRGSDRARERVARAVARAELEAAACRRALRGVPFPRVQTSPGGSRPSQCRAGGGGRGARNPRRGTKSALGNVARDSLRSRKAPPGDSRVTDRRRRPVKNLPGRLLAECAKLSSSDSAPSPRPFRAPVFLSTALEGPGLNSRESR